MFGKYCCFSGSSGSCSKRCAKTPKLFHVLCEPVRLLSCKLSAPNNGKITDARFLASFSSCHTISISVVLYNALHDASADLKQPALPICTQSVLD